MFKVLLKEKYLKCLSMLKELERNGLNESENLDYAHGHSLKQLSMSYGKNYSI
jgi:hypothetical protein